MSFKAELPIRKNYPTTDAWAEALCAYLNDFSLELEAALAAQPPIGTQAKWPAATFPSGWLKCDGASYATSRYPRLALVLGAAGASFNVPNVAGDMIRAI